jgi:hypothetical protein
LEPGRKAHARHAPQRTETNRQVKSNLAFSSLVTLSGAADSRMRIRCGVEGPLLDDDYLRTHAMKVNDEGD